jgi:GAF domain-containing protein/anti-sigma regulatory factor (Ser/Thr protein kinase)
MKCPRCQQENPPQAKFCLGCGAPLDATAAIGGFYAELHVEHERLQRAVAEASEQQTATSEILRVISNSPTDIQPVFETIAATALRLCNAKLCTVFRFDGKLIHLVALHQVSTEGAAAYRDAYPAPPGRAGGTHRAILTRGIVHIPDIREDPEYELQALARANDFGCVLSVPMLRDGQPVGAITVGREAGRSFSDEQIELLKTFASQALIAIENVRLFNETKEALEQQTATAEILRVISSSPTDVQPVFDAIARRVVALCDGHNAIVLRFDGEMLHLAGHHGVSPEGLERNQRAFPRRPGRDSPTGRAFLDRSVVHVPDRQTATEFVASTAQGAGSLLAVPLLREQEAIGVIGVTRNLVGPFSSQQVALLQTFADQAVIAIENVRLFNETKEALDRQTATAEILRVIASSPTELQPLLDSIATNAALVCDAYDAVVFLREGDHVRCAAHYGPIPITVPHTTLSRDSIMEAAILDRQPVHVHDLLATEPPAFPLTAKAAREGGFRTCLSVPLLRENEAIGALSIRRREVQPFTTQHIDVLKTFADQAVIAIENVRLFTELEARNRDLTEALQQQTATAEILRVIASSPTDIQPVLDAVAQNAARVCGADDALIYRVEGDVYQRVAHHGPIAETAAFERRLSRDTVSGRATVDRRTIHVPDIEAAPGDELPETRRLARLVGARTHLAAPLIREGAAIGAILIRCLEVRPFAPKQISLLETFADQAVIAIENVRLFKELEEKNRRLTVALDQQTATSEVLRAISSSVIDLQPVFDTIVRNAVKLCAATFGGLQRIVDGRMTLDAQCGVTTGELAVLQRDVFPLPISRGSATGRAVVDRAVVHIRDIREDPEFGVHLLQTMQGFRTILAVPMLREGVPIGALALWRREVLPFSDTEISLVQTFADQAVIAIENVRLFKELDARTQDLTRSVGELRALGEVGQAISSTLDLQTVLSTIVARATQLSGTDAGVIYEYDPQREVFLPRATEHLEAEIVETMLATPVRKGEGATGRLAEVQEAIQVPDILAAPAESRVRGVLVRAGYRALLAAPLVREEQLIGALTVIRKATGEFPPEVIDLLRTFATQSALAIQNARLFREIADKSRQLEVASRHKSEFLANMSHELRTPLNAIIGFSEVLSERMFGELNEKQDEYLKDIHASGQHLLSLINDILDLSKIEAGKMELELSDFDMPMTIDNALMLVRERAARRGIELHRTVDERLGQIQADERKIRQVLLNLLSNAIKFTPEGGRIAVEAKPVNGFIEVSVTDTGVGIAPEDQETVFEEFRQVGTADKKVEGTGLGLTLCRKFVEFHGGRIWVKSQVNEGSTFTFTIPVRSSE